MHASTSTTTTGTPNTLASASAAFGAVLWLAAPSIPAAPDFGSIEHSLLFAPLIAAPLAMRLLARSIHVDGTPPLAHRIATRAQPVAGAMLLGSFCVEERALAALLAAGWVITALLLAIGGVPAAARRPCIRLSRPSSIAAQVFLVAGAAWLLLSRLDVRPFALPPDRVFLASLHFHFSGFVLQVLIAATARALPASASLAVLHRIVVRATIAGIVIIAAGNVADAPIVKFIGVASMVLGTLGLAVTSGAVALRLRTRAPKLLLLASAVSIAFGMIVAAIYGVGELTGAGWIGIGPMVPIHGIVNALGFILPALVAHLRIDPRG
jgi:hypothetical protein